MSAKDIIIGYLQMVGDKVTQRELIHQLNLAKGTVSRILTDLVVDGAVERIEPEAVNHPCYYVLATAPAEGAYHGMTERNPDDAPQLAGPQEAILNPIEDDTTPFNATEHATRDALRAAQAALDNHRSSRKDPTEEHLQKAVDALTIALHLSLMEV